MEQKVRQSGVEWYLNERHARRAPFGIAHPVGRSRAAAPGDPRRDPPRPAAARWRSSLATTALPVKGPNAGSNSSKSNSLCRAAELRPAARSLMEASIASQLDVERERVDARQAVPKTADLPSG